MIFETKTCTGCKTCEIACSFRHRKIFNTSISSIEIVEKGLEFEIQLHESDQDGHLTCDGCEGREEPNCVKYCPPVNRNELKSVIEEFRWRMTH